MKELWIDLQAKSKTALYEQLYAAIRRNITDGKLSPGEKLPSTRFMAKNLGISRSTVAQAYDQLTAEGYLEPRQGSGYYVCDISELYQLSREHTGTEMREKRQQEKREQEAACPACEIRFSPCEVDCRKFPYAAWYRVNKELMPREDSELLLSGEAKGMEKLRSQISRYLYRARGVECRPEQIIVGAGNEYLLMLLAQIIGNGKSVLMEEYTYVQAYATFRNMGCHMLAAHTDSDGICMEDVRKSGADIVYVMPAHQFPLGIVMPLKRRLELLKWAAASKERYIVEDDHDSEFRYKGKPIPALWGNDRAGHVIYLGTFSKSITPSLRISYMVLPEQLLERYEKNCGFYACTVSRFGQELLYRFLEEGHFERHLNRMRNHYKQKQETLIALLERENWVQSVSGDHAGLHVLVEVKTSDTEEELCRRAAERGVEIHGLAEYCIGNPPKKEYPFVLLGYGNLNEAEMRRGLEILGRLIAG